MAIVVATQGPKLEVARAEAMAHAKIAAARHQHDADIIRVMQVLNYMKTLIASVTADNAVTFEAVYTETTLGA